MIVKTLILYDANANEAQKNIQNNIDEYYSILFLRLAQFLPYCKIHQTRLNYDDGEYYYDCFNDNITKEFQEKFINDLPLNESFDLVITNSCNPIIRDIFPFVLNISVGLFGSRPPYPSSLGLDPWGLFWKSLTYNAPIIKSINSDMTNAQNFLRKIKDYYQDTSGYNNINLFPFNSERHPYHVHMLKKTQVEYFKEFSLKNQNVYWTSKPNVIAGFGINQEFDYKYIQNLPQENRINLDSSFLIPNCNKVWATHSTLGFQAALHGVSIDSPASFYYWKGNQQGKIGALLNLVWFHDKMSFHDRIEKLYEFRKVPKKIKESTKNIQTYVNSNLDVELI